MFPFYFISQDEAMILIPGDLVNNNNNHTITIEVGISRVNFQVHRDNPPFSTSTLTIASIPAHCVEPPFVHFSALSPCMKP